MEAAFNNSFEKGLELERRIFVKLRREKSKAYVCFMQSGNKKPGLQKTRNPDINFLVVGAGTRRNIATEFANAGTPVKVLIYLDAVETE